LSVLKFIVFSLFLLRTGINCVRRLTS